jgi:hypothetical protein
VYKEPAYIIITEHRNTLMGATWRDYTFEWSGSKYSPAYFSKIFYDQTKGKFTLPWPVKVIEDNLDFGREVLVVRKDVGLHLWWILVYLKRRIFNNRPYKHFKWRVIMTLDIWGLAWQPEGEVTSWRNIGRKRKKR